MSTRRYIVVADRPSAVFYLRWEYGHKTAARLAKQLRPVSWRLVEVKLPIRGGSPFKLRRDAEAAANRVREAAAYMRGRLGKELGGTVGVAKLEG